MATQMELLIEAERRGILPEEKKSLLQEARRRNLIPQLETPAPTGVTEAPSAGTTTIEEPTPPIEQPLPGEAAVSPGLAQFLAPPEIRVDLPLTGAAESVRRHISNIPKDIGRIGSDIIDVFKTPVETAKNLGTFALGVLNKLTPGRQVSEDVADAFGQMWIDKYGSLENAKRTFEEHPAEFWFDVSMFAQVAGAGVTKAGNIAKSAKVAKMGRLISNIGKAADPARAVGATLKGAAKLIGKPGKHILGQIQMRSPVEFAKAAEGGQDFVRALRGEIQLSDVVQSAQGGFRKIKELRTAEYFPRLQRLRGLTEQLDITPIREVLEENLKKFNIKRLEGGGIGPDSFARSTLRLDPGAQTAATSMINLIDEWGTFADDLTPARFDTLKRILDNTFNPNKDTSAMTASLRNAVKKELVSKVPEYAEMTKKYQEITGLIHDVEDGLSLGSKFKMDTATRKFKTLLRQDNQFRLDLINEVQTSANVDILAQLSGISGRDLLSRGIFARGLEVISIGNIAQNIAAIDPYFATLLITTSPKATSELLLATGRLGRAAQKASKAVLPAVQAARIQEAAQQIPEPVLSQ